MLGAFGWRALARELVGKIPMGGGLIPKAAIAYAGTRVVGLSLERLYRIGPCLHPRRAPSGLCRTRWSAARTSPPLAGRHSMKDPPARIE